jgi:hypothetical protein
MCFELEKDMITVKEGPEYIGIKGKKESAGTSYEGHEFLEASSMRKFNGTYYFIYSSYLSHELCYATSNCPTEGFEYGGTLISNGDIGLQGRTKKAAVNYTGNTHGSLIEIKGKYYVFYHRQTNRKQFSRQACAEEIKFEDGKFRQAELTSCGLNGKPLEGKGTYEARIACNLTSRKGARWYWALKGPKGIHPYFTQTGKDREDNPDQYIANFTNGATAVFKYFEFKEVNNISVEVRGKAMGKMIISTKKHGLPAAEIEILPCKLNRTFTATIKGIKGIEALYFTFIGKGKLDFISFNLDYNPMNSL